jgi:hypothetical protein
MKAKFRLPAFTNEEIGSFNMLQVPRSAEKTEIENIAQRFMTLVDEIIFPRIMFPEKNTAEHFIERRYKTLATAATAITLFSLYK